MSLTPHHHKLIRMRLEGNTNHEIARELKQHDSAVDYHFTRIFRILGIRRFGELPLAYANYRQERRLYSLPFLQELKEAIENRT